MIRAGGSAGLPKACPVQQRPFRALQRLCALMGHESTELNKKCREWAKGCTWTKQNGMPQLRAG